MSGEGDEVMTAVVPQGVEPFHGLEINALARQLEADGRDIAFLEQGQPAAPPAPRVIEAVRAVLDGPQMYTHFAGTPALRDALARYYAEQHGVTVSPDSIVATMGSSSGFILAFLGGFEPGARIAVTRPGYTAYLNTLYGMGYEPVEIPVDAAHGWHLTAADIEAVSTTTNPPLSGGGTRLLEIDGRGTDAEQRPTVTILSIGPRYFDTLGLPRLANTPEIRVEIMSSREAPGGVGEIAVPPVAPALANALFAATGKRLRHLPFTVGGE